MPEHPGGEEAVEERLHQRRAEEVIALASPEVDAQRLLQVAADLGQLGEVAGLHGLADAGAGLAGVGGQEPRHLLRRF